MRISRSFGHSRISRLHVVVLAISVAFLLAAAAPRAARACAEEDIGNELLDVQNAMLEAASEQLDGETEGAVSTLQDALVALEALQESLGNPTIADELGRKVKAVRNKVRVAKKKVNRALVTLQNDRKKARVKLNRLRTAAKAAYRAIAKVRRPVVGELNARSAGFHNPGAVVRLQIYAADGSPCTETPVVVVENLGSAAAIDLDSVVVDESTGIITLTMGEEAGGGRVTVTACGRTSTVLLYNYGPKPPKWLPDGFPFNLPQGSYVITYSASGDITIPETLVATVELETARAFAEEIVAMTRRTVKTVSAIDGCSSSARYSSFDGTSFRAIWNVNCSMGPVGVEMRIVFRIQKV